MKILVEDEPDMLDTIVSALKGEQYMVKTASTYEAAIQKIHNYQYDCILLDISLQDKQTGAQYFKALDKTEGVMKTLSKEFYKPEGISFSPEGNIFISNEGKRDPGNIVEVKIQ